MNIKLVPTSRFETVTQPGGRVLCRIWEGMSDTGSKVVAHIALVGLHNDAPASEHELWAKALREVETERHLVSFDMRMVL